MTSCRRRYRRYPRYRSWCGRPATVVPKKRKDSPTSNDICSRMVINCFVNDANGCIYREREMAANGHGSCSHHCKQIMFNYEPFDALVAAQWSMWSISNMNPITPNNKPQLLMVNNLIPTTFWWNSGLCNYGIGFTTFSVFFPQQKFALASVGHKCAASSQLKGPLVAWPATGRHGDGDDES